ncbi:Oidioi.mRNA.OKI2018_I69.PAR.g12652.t1.cds [Oikopleura dioica]|uniref:Oidioi.mRNA.OKI2018_I69.PAR.g12652.t1.cds n=1 Tax=Oikopleura dioica TaxID=34765 RepID=A0ABN7S5I8_OIKDI|nr:Oidioi.mRNA.OKI2018_I69.PAR.g12652.t1.cds [Oikopleura dioica]
MGTLLIDNLFYLLQDEELECDYIYRETARYIPQCGFIDDEHKKFLRDLMIGVGEKQGCDWSLCGFPSKPMPTTKRPKTTTTSAAETSGFSALFLILIFFFLKR